MKLLHGIAVAAIGLVGFAYASLGPLGATPYATWQSLEPDSWASIWLIRTHIDPSAEISVRPAGSHLSAEWVFGVPGSQYSRDKSSSGFEKLLAIQPDPDPTLVRLGQIITAMESISWSAEGDPVPAVVEQAFRTLQHKFDRRYVPVTCYGQFFDVLYVLLQQNASADEIAVRLDETLLNSAKDCQWEAQAGSGSVVFKEKNKVDKVAIPHLLELISAGRKVVFIDTRETLEYEAEHIPGALNIKLRDINAKTAEELLDADIVISYCLKDFRGYEVARKLLHHGVSQSSVMDPHGYVAWKSLGLPVARENEPEALAVARLTDCASSPEVCLSKGKAR